MFKKKLDVRTRHAVEIAVSDVIEMLDIQHLKPGLATSPVKLDIYAGHIGISWECQLECLETGLKTLKQTTVTFTHRAVMKAIRQRHPQIGKPKHLGLSLAPCGKDELLRIIY